MGLQRSTGVFMLGFLNSGGPSHKVTVDDEWGSRRTTTHGISRCHSAILRSPAINIVQIRFFFCFLGGMLSLASG